MPAAVERFLSNVRRTLSPRDVKGPAGVSAYVVTAVNEPFVNKKIGSCLVQSRIGQGAMSIVYKGKQDITERIVAIKVLRAQLAREPSNVKRFAREAKAISRLSHPNLIAVFEVGELSTGQPYMVMEYVEGRSFADIIAADGACPWQHAVPLFMQACAGMAHAHQHNIIHRDIKPDNVMLMKSSSGSDLVKVVDFGIVKLIDESQSVSQRLTATGEVWGSPVYMSPEQCTGKTLDARSDIYALGITMYECLMARQLFDGKRITDVILKQLNQKPEPFATARPDLQVPTWVEAIVMKALEKDPAARFQSMEEMRLCFESSWAATPPGRSSGSAVAAAGAAAQSLAVPGATMLAPIAAQPEAELPPASQPSGVPGTPAEIDDNFINRTIDGKYLVQSKLGEGGMSIVYKAYQKSMDRFVAIKVIRDDLCEDESYKKRFQREAKTLSSLMHPNLVQIFDVGVAHTGQSYIVMEYLNGTALSDLIDLHGLVSPKRVVPIFTQVCDVMNFLHERGIIHRDLKPHNIMLVSTASQQDYVKIVDFGILKYDDAKHAVSQRLTAAGDICGSPVYMSPEQILDQKVDSRIDIYALGVSMYECITGNPPFVGKRVAEVLNQHLNVAPKPLSVARPELKLPPSLEKIVMRSLEKNRDARYQKMSEVRDDLVVLNGRLEQELTCVMNGQSVDGLPPLPVADRPAVAAPVWNAPSISGSAERPMSRPQMPSPPAAIAYPRSAPLQSSGKSGAKNAVIVALVACVALLIGACIALAVMLLNKNSSSGDTAGTSSNATSGEGTAGQAKDSSGRFSDLDGSMGKEDAGEVAGARAKSMSKRSRHHLHKSMAPTETLPEILQNTERANLYRHKVAAPDHWSSVEHTDLQR